MIPNRQTAFRGRRDYRPQRRRRIDSFAVALLLCLLFFPGLAFFRLTQLFDPRFVLGYALFVSGITCFLYWRDKRNAEFGEWRVAESTLHFAELLGGWPVAFLAQRAFRHKISKTSYQVTFWAVIVLHEFAAYDYLQDWQDTHRLFLAFQSAMQSNEALREHLAQ